MSDLDFNKYIMKSFFEGMVMYLSKDIIWFEYEQNHMDEKCVVCNIKLLSKDKCRISDCEHKFHADCIARYSDRIENCCPICKIEIKPLMPSKDLDEKTLRMFQEIKMY